MRSNQLAYLPTTLAQLKYLKAIDAADNKIQSLHPSVCDWHAIEKLELKDNPPVAAARSGIGAIRKFFQEMVMVGQIVSYGARLLMLGETEAGKTSLQRGLRTGQNDPTSPGEDTIGFEVYEMMLGEGEEKQGFQTATYYDSPELPCQTHAMPAC